MTPPAADTASSPLLALPPWPLVADEAGRLTALRGYHVLDTAPEPAFDEVVRAASALVAAPIALISLVDADRQWFKARKGLDVCETGRDVSFCAHVVAEDAEIICHDATLDPRFQHNALVTGAPGIRFYAGFPLRTSEGFVLGTLCLADVVARVIPDEHLATLRVLANQVVAQMELRLLLEHQQEAIEAQAALSAELTVSEARFRAAFEHGPMPMASLLGDGRFREANPAMRRLLARPGADLRRRTLAELIHPGDVHLLAPAVEAARRSRTTPIEARLSRLDGSWVHCEVACSVVASATGEPWVLVQLADLTARVEREADLERAARCDSLTGLRNREGLRLLLRGLTDLSLAAPCTTALMFIDLDGFKLVNDSFGHDAGDEVLREIARRLSSLVPASGGVARLGGDEFVLVVPDPTDPAGRAADILESLEDVVSDPVFFDGSYHSVGASVGVSLLEPGDDLEDALRRADGEMYAEKRWRKSPRVPAPPLDPTPPPSRDLVEMIEEGRLVCAYQPVVDLTSHHLTGVEALVRPVDRRGVPISPARFVEEAEISGDIHHLGAWVLRTAAAEINRVRSEVAGAEALTLGVNLSPAQLARPELTALVTEILESTGIPPTALVLELTEGQLALDDPATLVALRDLRRLGVGLAVDDFGTGFASVRYLRTFPFTVLKLDRSLTVALPDPDRAGSLARGAYRLAAALDLTVVAEGVETLAQQQAVLAEGCSLMQGFRFSRALPPEQLRALLTDPVALRACCGGG